MSYKTILVHLADEQRLPGLLVPAIALARRFGAHLVGLAVLPQVIVEPSLVPGGASVVIESHRKAFAEEMARMRQAFTVAARDAGVLAEWVSDDAGLWPVWRKVVEYGRAVDLIVAAQPVPLVAEEEELVLRSGRPVLFVPIAGNHAGLGKRVLIAWNGRREASRAAFDALPLLTGAEQVKVLWINPDDGGGSAEDVPTAALCLALARHKIKCEAIAAAAPDAGAGQALLGQVRDTGSDLLVMGCYGHSRVQELILGGATRHVFKHMTVPVLMAH